MITFFWPKKAIRQDWQRIKVGEMVNPRFVYHHGYGVLVRAGGQWFCWTAIGAVTYINGAARSVEVVSQNGETTFYWRFWPFLRAVFRACRAKLRERNDEA